MAIGLTRAENSRVTTREFDVILFGATGFTGKLVAGYLHRTAPKGFRWALAGRNLQKLEEVKKSLGATDVPLVQADSSDVASLEAMAKRTTVVCTTVGPYLKYGLPLIEACAKAGTHTCDLNGEPLYMRQCIDRFHAVAEQSGARIVHSCGFDSIPSDLGVQFLAEKVGPLKRATLVVMRMKGGFSGGTAASFLAGMEATEKEPSLKKIFADPYSLSPDRSKEPDLGKQYARRTVGFDDFVDLRVGPFMMEFINSRVVRRSNALLAHQWGPLRYEEVMSIPGGVKGAMFTAGLAGLGFGMGLMQYKSLREFLAPKVLPQPGEGPDEAARKAGYVKIRIFGETEKGERKSVSVEGDGDPGYQFTSMLLGESAMCLALDGEKLPKRAGVLTPSTAMGVPLRERLLAGGMRFRLD